MGERVKFGSLEGLAPASKGDATAAGTSRQVVVPMSEETMAAKFKHDAMMKKFNIEMRARTIAAPTNDKEVKEQLRNFEEPICLFGEGPSERRDRLKNILAKLEVEKGVSANEIVASTMAAQTQHVAEDKMKDVFYTEGAEELKAARIWIANFSLPRTGARLAASKRKQVALAAYVEKKQAKMRTASEAAQPKAGSDDDDTAMQAEEMVVEGEDEVDEEHTVFMDKAGRYRAMELGSSQIGDVRPISGANFSPDGQCLATCSWSGIAKVWTVPDCIEKFQLLGHSERLTDVKFSPGFKTGMLGQTNDGKTVGVATASADMRVKLWSANDMSDLHTLEGHTARLARIDFHPSGRFLGTASFDRTWRLWDLETQKALLVQEGHARAVYNIRFQRDGALAASTGLDAVCRVWDLRTGRSVITLQGHVKQVLGMDFCPSGVRLATGSDDNTVRVWDLRRRKALTVLPAHPSLVSSVKYSSCGDFLFTASYDRTVKVWNMLNNTCITTLAGHDEKVMCVDVSPEDTTVITTSYDRTFKLWTPGSY